MIVYFIAIVGAIGIAILLLGLVAAFIPAILAAILVFGIIHITYIAIALAIFFLAMAIIRFLIPAEEVIPYEVRVNENGENQDISQPLQWKNWIVYFGIAVIASVVSILLAVFGINPIYEFLMNLSEKIMNWVHNFRIF